MISSEPTEYELLGAEIIELKKLLKKLMAKWLKGPEACETKPTIAPEGD